MIFWLVPMFAWAEPNDVAVQVESASKQTVIQGQDLQIANVEMNIKADQFSFDIQQQAAIFKDNVRIQHSQFEMNADEVAVQNNTQQERIYFAKGNVSLKAMDRTIRSDQAHYWPEKQLIVLNSSVVVESEAQILKGDTIEINLDKEIRCQTNCSISWK